jgi:uncharacterized protein YutE (UPF0331/DUF86 family)
VIDRERILTKLDELDGYLGEIRSIAPDRLEEYRRIEKKRACERLLQLLVETTMTPVVCWWPDSASACPETRTTYSRSWPSKL